MVCELYDFSSTILMPDKSLRLTKRTRRTLERIHTRIMKDIVFSRFPYYTSKHMTKIGSVPQSKYAMHTFKEGNCVAFAYYTQFVLKRDGFPGATVVGVVPPRLFKRPGYKPISHAAVVLPYAKGYVLFDASFYYPRPVYIMVDDGVNVDEGGGDVLDVKNVYSGNVKTWSFKYVAVNDPPRATYRENARHSTTINGIVDENDVPSGTPYIKASFTTDGMGPDESRYYLRELRNADASVTIHTNRADRRVFYCKVSPFLDIELYYAVDMNTPERVHFRGRVNNIDTPTLELDISKCLGVDHVTDGRKDIVKWIEGFGLDKKGHEYKKMRRNVLKMYDTYLCNASTNHS